MTRVLLIDDEPFLGEAYARVLRNVGFEVDAFVDGEEALKSLATVQYSAVVSDVNMPRMSGLDLLRAIRERDLDLPVVLVTGSASVADAAHSIEYGAFRYLTKPIEPAHLAD